MKHNLRKAITIILVTVLLCSLFSFSTAATFAANTKISPELEGKIKGDFTSLIPVIIQTQQGLQEKHKVRLKNFGGNVKDDLSFIKGFSADIPASAVEDLAKYDDVTQISYDTEVHTCLDVAVPAINAPAAWAQGFTGN